MFEKTKNLIASCISWTRKGTDTPAYLHSFRVAELLWKFWFSEDIQLAGLLHDSIEDWGQSTESLAQLGYSPKVIELVDLCSHDLTISWSFEKRQAMIVRLIQAENKNARAIKLADSTDNLTECHLMPRDKLERFLFKKAPIFVYYGNLYFWGTAFYSNFLENYYTQIKRFHEYF